MSPIASTCMNIHVLDAHGQGLLFIKYMCFNGLYLCFVLPNTVFLCVIFLLSAPPNFPNILARTWKPITVLLYHQGFSKSVQTVTSTARGAFSTYFQECGKCLISSGMYLSLLAKCFCRYANASTCFMIDCPSNGFHMRTAS